MERISLKWSLFILGVAGILLAIFLWTFNSPKVHSDIQPALPPIGQTGQTMAGLPIRLKIPKINVDAAVDYVGLTADGAMDVPKGPTTVAWFDLGLRPGEIGSSVIDGHSGYKNNRPAVFDSLYKLQKGDEIYVQGADGTTTTFVVQSFRNYDPTANAENVFDSNDGKAHLNLITCSGDWNANAQTHSKRLVVFTDKE